MAKLGDRPLHSRGGVAILAALLLVSAGDGACATEYDFALAKGKAADQLAAWSRLTGIQLKSQKSSLVGKRTQAISGRMDARDALNLMLEGSKLEIVRDDGDVITVGPDRPAARVLDSQPLPPNPVLGGYDERIRRVLSAVFAPQVVARLTVESTFQPETAIGLKLDKGHYAIIAAESPVYIWRYSLLDMYLSGGVTIVSGPPDQLQRDIDDLRRGLPPEVADIRPTVCVADLESAVGRRLANNWRRVLARKVPRLPGLDGVTYKFAIGQISGERRRDIWSPSEESVDGQLVAVAQAMRAYCHDPSAAQKAALISGISELEMRLRQGD